MTPPSDPTQHFMLEPCDDQQRLDRYLARSLQITSRHLIHRLLRTGKILVNGEKVTADYRLHLTDKLQLFYKIEESVSRKQGPRRLSTANHTLLKSIQMLYEDDWLLVVNKPSGLAVHGGSGVSYGLIEWFREQRPDAPYLELVHRIDKGTSGLLLIAKKRSCLRTLHEQFRDQRIKKTYLALVYGRWLKKKCSIELSLKKRALESGGRFVHIASDGKPSRTIIRAQRTYADFSELKACPETGRTHQIRVHLSEIGYPILGDDRYMHEMAKQFCQRKHIKRLFLHAQALHLEHPRTKQPLHFIAPTPDDWETTIGTLLRTGAKNKCSS